MLAKIFLVLVTTTGSIATCFAQPVNRTVIGGQQIAGDTRTLDSLREFHIEEVSGGCPYAEKAKIKYSPPLGIDWECKISNESIFIGDPLIAEITVRNLAVNPTPKTQRRSAIRISPPERGWLCAHLQVWIRPLGTEKFTAFDGWEGYLGKSGHHGKYGKTPCTGVGVTIMPGETRKWTSRLDMFAGVKLNYDKKSSVTQNEYHWLGGRLFKTAGKYEVTLRYVNTVSESGLDSGVVADPENCRVFGPYVITVKDRTDVKLPAIAEYQKIWNATSDDSFDTMKDIDEVTAKPFYQLNNTQLSDAGTVGDDIRIWLLGRDWKSIHDSKDAYEQYVKRLNEMIRRLPSENANRSAVELMRAAALMEKESEEVVLKELLPSTNPDVQILLQEWLFRKLKKAGKEN